MAHEDDVARALRGTHRTALAEAVVELPFVPDPLEHALGAVGDAAVALVAASAGEAPLRLAGVGQAAVDLLEESSNLVDKLWANADYFKKGMADDEPQKVSRRKFLVQIGGASAVLTVTGVWFRGPGMALVWPWGLGG